jgi:glycine/D-amino acid oxidase-like deaminating enzyme/nitrite reductase/ring-hydroxylating ferredoxin subunit
MIQNSPWDRNIAAPRFTALDGSLATEVCVIGAGIAGLTTAYLLAREGKKVVVLDDGPVGGGETRSTSAHLCNALDNRFHELERLHGAEGARIAAESHTAAITMIETIVHRENIACEFRRLDGYLFEPPGRNPGRLDTELAAVRRAGLTGVEKVVVTPLPFAAGPALRFPDQAEFEPLRYLYALAQVFIGLGGTIHTGTHAGEITGKGPYRVTTATGFHVDAASVVVATNSPVNLRFAIHTKQAAYRTYVIGISIPRGSVVRALYWDDDNPYHYLKVVARPDAETDLLLVGGEDCRTGQDSGKKPFDKLESWTRRRFPDAGAVEYSWSGQVLEPVDSVAYIGRSPGETDVYVITGDSGNGLTHGTLGAMLIRDRILGRHNAWEKLYDPNRISPAAGAHFIKENLNTACQYLDLIGPGEVKNTAEISPGEGAVLRDGLHKLACYRDPAGAIHACSAICPHLEGVVRWNSDEKSWDCPCHGSRFDSHGRVLNGPANGDLSPATSPEEKRAT